MFVKLLWFSIVPFSCKLYRFIFLQNTTELDRIFRNSMYFMIKRFNIVFGRQIAQSNQIFRLTTRRIWLKDLDVTFS